MEIEQLQAHAWSTYRFIGDQVTHTVSKYGTLHSLDTHKCIHKVNICSSPCVSIQITHSHTRKRVSIKRNACTPHGHTHTQTSIYTWFNSTHPHTHTHTISFTTQSVFLPAHDAALYSPVLVWGRSMHFNYQGPLPLVDSTDVILERETCSGQ